MQKTTLLPFTICALLMLCSCNQNEPTYSSGKDLSVDGHTYFMVINNSYTTDTTFVSFDKNIFYVNNVEDGTYTQEKEVVKVINAQIGMQPNRIFISYGDFLLNQGVQYTRLK